MKKRFTVLAVGAAILAGCATVQRPPEEVAEVPVTGLDALCVRVIDARIVQVDGQLFATGTIRQSHLHAMTHGVQLDIEFVDAAGQELECWREFEEDDGELSANHPDLVRSREV